MNHKVSPSELATAIAGAVAEWLFSTIPLIVVAVVMGLYVERWPQAFESAEWAFGASVLASQSLYKFVAGTARAGGLSLERVLLGVSAVIVLAVAPANGVLVLVLLSELQKREVSSLLAVSQVALFVWSSGLFLLLATVSHLWGKGVSVETARSV
jgi:hypothetical protein